MKILLCRNPLRARIGEFFRVNVIPFSRMPDVFPCVILRFSTSSSRFRCEPVFTTFDRIASTAGTGNIVVCDKSESADLFAGTALNKVQERISRFVTKNLSQIIE